MIRAKNYKTVTKFVKVMPRILWPLFFPGHGVYVCMITMMMIITMMTKLFPMCHNIKQVTWSHHDKISMSEMRAVTWCHCFSIPCCMSEMILWL